MFQKFTTDITRVQEAKLVNLICTLEYFAAQALNEDRKLEERSSTCSWQSHRAQ